MHCVKCEEYFPRSAVVDGRRRNLQRRKYCLKCSPFGSHNTATLEEKTDVRTCRVCGKEMKRKKEKGKTCWACTNRHNKANKIERIQSVTGNACWLCGYDRCWQALDFHHVDPKTKQFPLTTRELQYTWDRVLEEAKKCVLVCCRCHREIHAGLIEDEVVVAVWKKCWDHSTMVVQGATA